MNIIWISIIVTSLFGLVFGVILEYISSYFSIKNNLVNKKISETLLKSQCDDSEHYSEVKDLIIKNNYIDQCSFEEDKITQEVFELLNADLNTTNKRKEEKKITRMIAVINEEKCIGCTKCIHACPFDAIIGSHRMMHTVVEHLCTGCNRCVLSCPMKCIDIHLIPFHLDKWNCNLQVILDSQYFSK